jgi:hypothetical protein
MTLLFRKNESTAGKCVAIAILSSFALAVYGFINRGNFMESPSNAFLAFGLPIALGLISTVYFYKDPHPENKIAKLGLIARIVLFPGLAAFMSFVYWATIDMGIPLIHTQITGTQTIAETTVAGKLPERSGKGCHYRIYVKSKEVLPNGYTCVAQEIWTNAKPGDRLIAEMRVGTLGTYISTLRPE